MVAAVLIVLAAELHLPTAVRYIELKSTVVDLVALFNYLTLARYMVQQGGNLRTKRAHLGTVARLPASVCTTASAQIRTLVGIHFIAQSVVQA